jgi:hypothetical protein
MLINRQNSNLERWGGIINIAKVLFKKKVVAHA